MGTNSPLNSKNIKCRIATKTLTLKPYRRYAMREGISEGSKTKYEKGGGILSIVLAPLKVSSEAKAAKIDALAISRDFMVKHALT